MLASRKLYDFFVTSKAAIGSYGLCSELAATLAFVPWASIGSGAVCSGFVLYQTSGIGQQVADILSFQDHSSEGEYSANDHTFIDAEDVYNNV